MLTIDGLDAYYGKSHVLHELSMEIGSDEIVALLGRNGAGKTTTCRSIMGVVPRAEGSISMDGEEVCGSSSDEVFKHGISWIPERRRVFPNLSVRENLEMGLGRAANDGSMMGEVFDLFPRLEERTAQKAGTMSGGEQQMLAIGRALMCRPRLLLVDEPFEGLMPTLVNDVADVLNELATRDIAMLIADQRTDKTLKMADRAYIIENGRIVHEATAQAVADDRELQEQYLGVQ